MSCSKPKQEQPRSNFKTAACYFAKAQRMYLDEQAMKRVTRVFKDVVSQKKRERGSARGNARDDKRNEMHFNGLVSGLGSALGSSILPESVTNDIVALLGRIQGTEGQPGTFDNIENSIDHLNAVLSSLQGTIQSGTPELMSTMASVKDTAEQAKTFLNTSRETTQRLARVIESKLECNGEFAKSIDDNVSTIFLKVGVAIVASVCVCVIGHDLTTPQILGAIGAIVLAIGLSGKAADLVSSIFSFLQNKYRTAKYDTGSEYVYNDDEGDKVEEGEETEKLGFVTKVLNSVKEFLQDFSIKFVPSMDRIKSLLSGFSTITKIGAVFTFLATFMSKIYLWIVNDNVLLSDMVNQSTLINDMMEWEKQTWAMIVEGGHILATQDRTYAQRIREHATKGDAIHIRVVAMQQLDAMKARAHTFNQWRIQFSAMLDSANMALCPQTSRPEPTAVYFMGDAGVGKSTLIPTFVSDVLNRLTPGIAHDGHDCLYRRNLADEFWSGYRNQPACLLDDAFQMVDNDAIKGTCNEIINMINSCPYPLNMPSLSQKGVTQFSSNLVIFTSNRDLDRSVQDIKKTVFNWKAIRRRIHFIVHVRPREEFRGTRGELDLSKVRAHQQLVGGKPVFDTSVLEFSIRRHDSPDTEAWVPYEELVATVFRDQADRARAYDTMQRTKSQRLAIEPVFRVQHARDEEIIELPIHEDKEIMKRAWSDAYIQSVYDIDDDEFESIFDQYKTSRIVKAENADLSRAQKMFSLSWDAAAHARFDFFLPTLLSNIRSRCIKVGGCVHDWMSERVRSVADSHELKDIATAARRPKGEIKKLLSEAASLISRVIQPAVTALHYVYNFFLRYKSTISIAVGVIAAAGVAVLVFRKRDKVKERVVRAFNIQDAQGNDLPDGVVYLNDFEISPEKINPPLSLLDKIKVFIGHWRNKSNEDIVPCKCGCSIKVVRFSKVEIEYAVKNNLPLLMRYRVNTLDCERGSGRICDTSRKAICLDVDKYANKFEASEAMVKINDVFVTLKPIPLDNVVENSYYAEDDVHGGNSRAYGKKGDKFNRRAPKDVNFYHNMYSIDVTDDLGRNETQPVFELRNIDGGPYDFSNMNTVTTRTTDLLPKIETFAPFVRHNHAMLEKISNNVAQLNMIVCNKGPCGEVVAGAPRQINILFIKGKYALGNAHFFRRRLIEGQNAYLLINFAGPKANTRCSVDDVLVRSVVESDLVMLDFSNIPTLPSSSDITSYFFSRDELALHSPSGQLYSALVPTAGGPDYLTVRAWPSKGIRYGQFAFKGAYPGEGMDTTLVSAGFSCRGACGSPLVWVDCFNRCKVVSILNGSRNDTVDMMYTTLTSLPCPLDTIETSLGKFRPVREIMAVSPPSLGEISYNSALLEKQRSICENIFSRYPDNSITLVPMEDQVRLNVNSKIVPSPLYGVFPTDMAPANLKASAEHPCPVAEFATEACEPAWGPAPMTLLNAENHLFSTLEERTVTAKANRKVWTVDQALNSQTGDLEYSKEINLSTSPGWPYNSYGHANKYPKGKVHWIEMGDHGFRSLTEAGMEEYRKAFDCVSSERPDLTKFVFLDTLKDETRKLAKVNKPRIFNNPPWTLNVLLKQYYGAFAADLLGAHMDSEIRYGMDATDVGKWCSLYNYLIDRDYNENGLIWMCGDFKNFDKKLPLNIVDSVFDIMDKWYHDVWMDDDTPQTREENLIRHNLRAAVAHSYRQCMNVRYRVHGGNPSGNALTTVINCIANCLLHRCAYYDIVGGLRSWDRRVRLVVYGDDSVVTVSHEDGRANPRFNQTSLQRIFASYGIVYTDGTKNADTLCRPATPFEEVTFLKRTFHIKPEDEDRVERGEAVLLYPALDKITIQNAIQWMNKTNDVNSQLEATLANMSREAANHGLLYFISFSKAVRAKLDELGIEIHVQHYQEATSKLRDFE